MKKIIRKMKLVVFFAAFFICQVSAIESKAQHTTVDLHMENATLLSVIQSIESQTDYVFFYSNEEIDLNKTVNIHIQKGKINEILDNILSPYAYTIEEKRIHIIPHILQNKRQITGTVTDQKGQPIIGATVMEKGTTYGVVTDINGIYTIQVDNNATLLFRYIGMRQEEVAVRGRSSIDIVLKELVSELSEVTVTALGIKKERRSLGYATQELTGSAVQVSHENNLVNALSGKLAGVQITNTSGGVASSARIVIRGAKSLSGNNQPLFVVDGVPVHNSNSSTFLYGGVDYGNEISDIDPNNIESVNVLKGANAAALYGSRAANGVILITTKSAEKADKGVGVTFTSNIGLNNVKYIPKLQNKYGRGLNGEYNYVDGVGGGLNDSNSESWGPPLDGRLVDQWFGKQQPWVARPNNVKDFFQMGTVFTNDISITQKSDKVNTRISFGDYREKGTLPNTDQVKNTININNSINIVKGLDFDMSASYINLTNDNLSQGGYTGGNFMNTVIWGGREMDWSRQKDYINKDGSQKNMYSPFDDNPYFLYNKNTNSRKRQRLFGNISLKWQITDWLNVMGRVGLDTYAEHRKSVTDAFTASVEQAGHGGKFSMSEQNYQELNFDFIASFNKSFLEKWDLSADVGANLRKNNARYVSLGANELVIDNLFNISNVKGNPTRSNSTTEYENQGVFGQVNIGYGKFIYLNATARNDWSSTLPKENWSYFYPSAGLSLLLNDLFKIESKILSYSKIRYNWAQVGNATSPYALTGIYSSADAWEKYPVYSAPTELPPINLKPEITTSSEVGLDLVFFMNRLTLDATWYSGSSKNQILSITTSAASGNLRQKVNAGEIKNSGIEVKLGGTPVLTKDFRWDLTLNWSKNKSEIVDLYPGIDSYTIGGIWGCNVLAKPGGTYGDIYHRPFARDEAGNVIIGANGVPQAAVNVDKLGTINPDWLAGLMSSFTYKNLTLNVLFDMRKGSDIFLLSYRYGCMTGVMDETARGDIRETGFVFPGVKENGSVNDIVVSPQVYYKTVSSFEPYIFDASFLKLRELSLSYSIPQKYLAWTKAVKRANVSFVGRNLWLLHSNLPKGYDPEVSLGGTDAGQGVEYGYIPTNASYNFSLQLVF
ncbi:TonB-linked SusC/RagA family outer membrane protein [Parabacteroides sp. PFB2-10]|uniref:SusC/RagA family TonB-linked outer membrane protein n=1 Tax=Parabacteroides sp. PFB2-10 TaxID=1742405 RepID=UPI002476B42D|nr:SusC/RagA family TonB-linked outer membrane protein [Parabacteroides sp. PFB2-10]MDH6311325.1 TonB-linked SusC/RagA family outer membrane protein [Parabacteroides sp. PFB2-10]